MKKPTHKVYTCFNPPPPDPEINFGVSMTIPDDTMSIPELIARSAQGYPLPVGRTPYFTDTDDFDDHDEPDHDYSELDEFMTPKEKIPGDDKKKAQPSELVNGGASGNAKQGEPDDEHSEKEKSTQ